MKLKLSKKWFKKKIARENGEVGAGNLNFLEKMRQEQFADEERKESVFTRPIESIVDIDSV